MSDEDRFAALFAGKPGSVLGEFRDTPDEQRTGFINAKAKAVAERREPPRRDRGPRVPPGQEVVDKWPVLDLGHQPLIPLDQWSLDIKGAVARPLSLDWQAFKALPQARISADIHCVTAWSMLDNIWEGVSARHLIEMARPRDTVKHVIFHAHDGYRTNVSLERFTAEKCLLAHSWNGELISREHGGPVRTVIPSLYFWKSAKWVRQITFLENDVKGYWEALGYHNEGDPWKEERYG
ncbi:MAG: sulfite oxidase-like oxidoreductase [Rhodospirillales bacterium]